MRDDIKELEDDVSGVTRIERNKLLIERDELKAKLQQVEAQAAEMRLAMIFFRDEIDYESKEESARATKAITLALDHDCGQSILARLEEARWLLELATAQSHFGFPGQWWKRRDAFLSSFPSAERAGKGEK